MNKVVFFDFHSTLAYWSPLFGSAVLKVLDEFEKGHTVTLESLRPWLENAFPWDQPEKSYMHLRDPETWWNNLYGPLEKAYIMNGFAPEKANKYKMETRKQVANYKNYGLYDDTLETLKILKENGYRSIILSNHIPELPQIAESLGLMDYIDVCITSADVGFEKPNPGIFKYGLKLAGNPESAWMVGDSLFADVRGGEAAGLKSILVRAVTDEPVKYYSPDLSGIIELIMS